MEKQKNKKIPTMMMRPKFILSLKCIALASLAYATADRVQGPVSAVTIHLVDEDGAPVPDTLVYGCQDVTYESDEQRTDSKGFATVKVHGKTSTIGLDTPFNDKQFRGDHYKDRPRRLSDYFTTHNKLLNRWEPYPLEVTHVLKRVKKPVPMIISDLVRRSSHPIQALLPIELDDSQERFFDFIANDWLPPYGSGKIADMGCTLLTGKDALWWSVHDAYEKKYGYDAMREHFGHIPPVREKDQYPLKIKVRFLREGDGVIFDYSNKLRDQGSVLWSEHEAPKSGYLKEFIYDSQEVYLNPFYVNYFRIRSENDGKAIHVASDLFTFYHTGFYSQDKSSNELPKELRKVIELVFNYKLNPDSGSRSLEWNGVDARTGKLVRKDWRGNQNLVGEPDS